MRESKQRVYWPFDLIRHIAALCFLYLVAVSGTLAHVPRKRVGRLDAERTRC